jgi:hypothetical protein
LAPTARRRTDRGAGGRQGDHAGRPEPHRPLIDPASFRDPSGYVFRRDGILYRAIQPEAAADWAAFEDRGLAAQLIGDGLLVGHAAVATDLAPTPGVALVIRPREIGVISYPYEWAFSQLREAALLTLEVQRRALAVGMWLRDASAYNVQFDAGRPILIDSLSFEVADLAAPWPAYRQFCKHFLAPLALMAHRDPRCGLMLRDFIDGIPLDLAAGLLPGRTRLGGLLAHLHLHAGADRRVQAAQIPGAADPAKGPPRSRPMTQTRHDALLDSLRRTVEGLKLELGSHWLTYTRQTSYTETAAESKRAVVQRMLDRAGGSVVWDLGANVGTYSDLAAGPGREVIAFDQDPAVVELHWRNLSAEARASVLPLVMDLTNPSPSLGWAHEERRSLLQRGPADVAMALALIHHLAVGNNVPLPRVAALLADAGRRVIIEFVPREDPMVQQLLAGRKDIFGGYTLDGFRAAFGERFTTLEEAPVADSLRTIFLLERREA